MFRHLSNELFVNHVLETGVVRFAVKANLFCEEKLIFEAEGIRIFPPRPSLQGFAFEGEIEIRESNLEGIRQGLQTLESWADILCLTIGSAKITVQVLLPMDAQLHTSWHLHIGLIARMAQLTARVAQLEAGEKGILSRALWWYRKACVAREYSIFDSYSAYWNSLEIICNVSGGRINEGPEVDSEIKRYLETKNEITSGVINDCYNKFVYYSIKRQMEDSLRHIFQDEAQGSQWVYYCFGVSPGEDRLYQIRNNINHGNIRENSHEEYERVFRRGVILAELVRRILFRKLGGSMSSEEKDIDQFVEDTITSGGSYDVFYLSG